MNSLLPSPTILAGIIAGLALPLLLVLLSHGPWKIASPGWRFKLSAFLVSAGWLLYIALQQAFDPADLLASLMILLTALLVGFTFWSLVAWGFTVSLLTTLARAQQPLTAAEWVASYTDGGSVETFAQDRLGILFRFRLAYLDGAYVRLTPGWGPRLAASLAFIRRMYGVS